jgi:hypothetical protein
MYATRHHAPAGAELAGLVERALFDGVPARVAEEARRAAAAKFGAAGSRGVSHRAEAYFWGVVRHRALRGAAPSVRDRLLVTSLVEELREAGHGPVEVHAELERVYGDAVDRALIETYRPAPRSGRAA